MQRGEQTKDWIHRLQLPFLCGYVADQSSQHRFRWRNHKGFTLSQPDCVYPCQNEILQGTGAFPLCFPSSAAPPQRVPCQSADPSTPQASWVRTATSGSLCEPALLKGGTPQSKPPFQNPLAQPFPPSGVRSRTSCIPPL